MNQDQQKPLIYVIIPAFNESKSIGKVIADIPDMVSEIIVVDNASTDNTGEYRKRKRCYRFKGKQERLWI
jgi:glycosyltransferase involved in cell wall biosynthesis